MSSPIVRGLIALIALTSVWIGLAILIAGIRAGIEGTPERIGAVLAPLTPLL
jgi:hypothetical protein